MTKPELIALIERLPQKDDEELQIIIWDGDDNHPVDSIEIDAVNHTELIIVLPEYARRKDGD